MKPEAKLLMALVGTAVAVFVLILWWQGREPAYGGKSLTYWIEQLDGQNAGEAQAAISQIGARAVPCLLRKLRQESASTRRHHLPAAAARERDEMLKARVELAFTWIGPPAVPGLIKALQDSNDDVRLMALIVIRAFRPLPEAAVPGVIRLLDDPNETIRFEAVTACRRMKTPPQAAIAALTGVLKDNGVGHSGSTVHIRERAAQVLGTMGAAAQPAVPELIRLSWDTNAYTRQQAELALWRITRDTNLVSRVVAELENAPDAKTYKRFLNVLAEIGPTAKPAVPVLLRATTNIPAATSRPVREALLKIDSDAAAGLEGAR